MNEVRLGKLEKIKDLRSIWKMKNMILLLG